MLKRWKQFKVGLCATGISLVVTCPATAAICLNDSETLAQNLQHFQIQVMVSGDRCGTVNPSYQTLYNQYMTQFGSDLKSNQSVLKNYFNRSFGARSTEFFDRYLTAMANTVSSQSNYMPGFCDRIGASLAEMLAHPSMSEGHAAIDTPLKLEISGTRACTLPAYISATSSAE